MITITHPKHLPHLDSLKKGWNKQPQVWFDYYLLNLFTFLQPNYMYDNGAQEHQGKSQTTVSTVVWAEVHLFQVPHHHDAHSMPTTSPRHHHVTTTWPPLTTVDHEQRTTTASLQPPPLPPTTTTTKRLATTLTHPTTTKTMVATPVAADTFFFC